MIFELDSNRALFVARCRARESGLAEAVKRPNLTPAVSPKYLSDETKIYIFIDRIPRIVCRIFLGLFKIFIFSTPGRYLQTSAPKPQP